MDIRLLRRDSMKVSLARDTLEIVKKTIKYGVLTDKDLAQINSIVIKRLESVEDERNNKNNPKNR